ncbi:hypothetical protein R5R35_006934 [Gryllus longicercus]|uniref:Uncharacterized protein n=1 Tax=Gryllus longicercus TaxID=2509291 RepID=A0AAN9VFT4_9ORTH
MGVIDPCTQAAFQTENGSSVVEHAATASAADAYSSLVKDLYHPCEVSPQVVMDDSHDPCTTGQVQEAILGNESVPSVCDPLPEMVSEACILGPTSLTPSGFKLMFALRSQNSEK